MKGSFCTRFSARIRGQLGALTQAQETFISWLRHCGIPEADQFQWKLVFTEALTNAIRYGGKESENPHILIELEARDGSLLLSVQQQGKGPDLDNAPKACLPEDPLSERGRGRFIIESFADRTEHWEGPLGYRLVIEKAMPEGTLSPARREMNELLGELSFSYESLSAYNRMGQQLLFHESLTRFIGETIENIKMGHPFRDILLYPAKDLPDSLIDRFDENNPFEERGFQWSASPRQIYWNEPDDLPEFLKEKGMEASCGMVYPVSCQEMHVFDAVITFDKTADMSSPVVNLFNSIADLLGLAAGVTILQQVREQQAQQQKEWEIATQLQISLLPMRETFSGKGFSIGFFHKSAEEVAGDYALVRSLPDNDRTHLAIIDVMGKGVRSALLAILFRGAFHLLVQEDPEPGQLLTAINDLLCRLLGDMVMFITAAVCRFDSEKETLEWANAGHCELIGLSDDDHVLGPASGPPLGVIPGSTYLTESWSFNEFRQVALYTDGCYEWTRKGRLFDKAGLIDHLRAHIGRSHGESWENLNRLINETADEDSHLDDVTLVLCDFTRP